MSRKDDATAYFRAMRFDSHHLGLGDIRLTIGEQETIIQTISIMDDEATALRQRIERLEAALEKKARDLHAAPYGTEWHFGDFEHCIDCAATRAALA